MRRFLLAELEPLRPLMEVLFARLCKVPECQECTRRDPGGMRLQRKEVPRVD